MAFNLTVMTSRRDIRFARIFEIFSENNQFILPQCCQDQIEREHVKPTLDLIAIILRTKRANFNQLFRNNSNSGSFKQSEVRV